MDETRLQKISQLRAFLAGTMEVRFGVPGSWPVRKTWQLNFQKAVAGQYRQTPQPIIRIPIISERKGPQRPFTSQLHVPKDVPKADAGRSKFPIANVRDQAAESKHSRRLRSGKQTFPGSYFPHAKSVLVDFDVARLHEQSDPACFTPHEL